VTLTTFAAAYHPQLAIDICCLQGAQQQTCWLPLLLLINVMDRRMDAQPLCRLCSSYYVGSVNNARVRFKKNKHAFGV